MEWATDCTAPRLRIAFALRLVNAPLGDRLVQSWGEGFDAWIKTLCVFIHASNPPWLASEPVPERKERSDCSREVVPTVDCTIAPAVERRCLMFDFWCFFQKSKIKYSKSGIRNPESEITPSSQTFYKRNKRSHLVEWLGVRSRLLVCRWRHSCKWTIQLLHRK